MKASSAADRVSKKAIIGVIVSALGFFVDL